MARRVRRRMSMAQIIGLVLLIAGAVVLAYGAFELWDYNTSTGGKFANSIAGAFGKRTEKVENLYITMGIGLAGLVVGIVLYRKR